MIEKDFDFNGLYDRVLKYYLRKHYSKEEANLVAQKVVQKEIKKRSCKNQKCGHLLYDHLRNYDSCLVEGCDCRGFVATYQLAGN